MIQTDRTNFVAWGLGSGGGVYSGIFPPEFLSGIKSNLALVPVHSMTDRFIDLTWAILTAIIVTAVSFFITKMLQKLTKHRHGTRIT